VTRRRSEDQQAASGVQNDKIGVVFNFEGKCGHITALLPRRRVVVSIYFRRCYKSAKSAFANWNGYFVEKS
jgi:hypothetical protein